MIGKPVGLQKCSFGASAWRTTNTELGLPTGPHGAGWAMHFLGLPFCIFILTKPGLNGTSLKKQQGFRSTMNEIPAVFAHLLF